MPEQIQLDIVTPERRLLAEKVDAVYVPGMSGEFGILVGHTPLISRLQTGVLSYTRGSTTERLHVSGGFVEVNQDRVTVLADVAERPEEIDAARARMAHQHAEKALSGWSGTEEDFEVAQARLERSIVRLQLASGSSER